MKVLKLTPKSVDLLTTVLLQFIEAREEDRDSAEKREEIARAKELLRLLR